MHCPNYSTHLRGNVIRSAAECPCLVAVIDPFLAEPKVGNLDVALGVQHDIVQLEVTVDDTPLVEVQQAKDDLGSIEPGEVEAQ